MTATLLFGASVLLSLPATGETIQVVTTLPVYASLAREVGGDHVTVESIARADEDAHFVKPKPSLALMLRKADLFVTTGLDLELWAPVLVDKSGNRKIVEGEPGVVRAAEGVPMLDVPTSSSRAAGDVHIYGNPHVFTSPLNAKIIAANIAAGLERVDPANASDYKANLSRFEHRIDVSLYGEKLLSLLDARTLDPLARQGRLVPFLQQQEHDGVKLISLLGGWLGKGMVFRGQPIVAYHKNWSYLFDLFGLEVIDYVEPKPGIPPSARHVHDLIEAIQDKKVRVLLAASYFGRSQLESIAERSGTSLLAVPLGPSDDGEDYFSLVDAWVDGLAAAYSS
jgi:ABC-type Zn uptake system ZnuABC Zn-binding protein ZnuA